MGECDGLADVVEVGAEAQGDREAEGEGGDDEAGVLRAERGVAGGGGGVEE